MTYTKGKLDLGAYNNVPEMILKRAFIGNVVTHMCVEEARDKTQAEMNKYNRHSMKDYAETLASWSKLYGCGNCGEQSAIAFVYLRDTLKQAPLDWMMYNDWAHAFVIIGRTQGDPLDLNTWNREAVLCDPWKYKVAAAVYDVPLRANRLTLLTRYAG